MRLLGSTTFAKSFFLAGRLSSFSTIGTPLNLRGPPYRQMDEAVAKCVDCSTAKRAQMRYDKYQQLGLQIGSGLVQSACRQIVGSRMKQPGRHWSFSGANAALSIKCDFRNRRWVDLLHWKAQQAPAA